MYTPFPEKLDEDVVTELDKQVDQIKAKLAKSAALSAEQRLLVELIKNIGANEVVYQRKKCGR